MALPPTEGRTRRFSRTLNALGFGILVALALTAVIAATAHVLTGQVVSAQSANARVVNVSGRQRMLSQRISLLATRWVANGLAADRQRLLDAVEMFEQSHLDLVSGQIDGQTHTLPAAVHSVYFDAPYKLNAQVSAFITDARIVLGAAPGRAAAAERMSNAAGPPPFHASALLGGLNAVVYGFQAEHDRQIERLKSIQTGALWVLALVATAVTTLVLFPLLRRVKHVASVLNRDALTDALTGANNRRGFWLRAETVIAQRAGGAVLALDIDNFKRINDTRGHAMGDTAIRKLAQIVDDMIREGDVFGRLGGDEFAIVIHGSSHADAVTFAERLRQAVEATKCVVTGDSRTRDPIAFTVSIGVRSYAKPTPLDALMGDADGALYDAKRAGRNCVRATATGKTIPFPSASA